MRIASVALNSAVSVAKSLAMPASMSQRSPVSQARAADSVRRREASSRVAISASLIWIDWCSQIGLPKVLRTCA